MSGCLLTGIVLQLRDTMRFGVAVSVLAAFTAYAQLPTELKKVQEEVEKTRLQVEAGVLPRARLAEIEARLADAQDDQILRETLYGPLGVEDLTERQAGQMIAAAERRLETQRRAIEAAKRLVDAGAASLLSLSPYYEELERRMKTVDLAQSRANVLREIAAMARREQEALAERSEPGAPRSHAMAVRFDGDGSFSTRDLAGINAAFQNEFGKTLPVSAHGMTAVHRALGYDHRGRVDVALNPDQREGEWLLDYLERERIPYFAFRRAISGSATAPHIHIGTPSPRIASRS